MIWVIKVLLIVALAAIFYQDMKDQLVYWFLFLIVGVCTAILHLKRTLMELWTLAIGMNLIFIASLILVIHAYAKLKMKMKFKHVIGAGDLMLFFALAFSFSTISFIIVFVFALVFALVMHLFLKNRLTYETVPLAGYMSLFFGLIYIGHWAGFITSIYSI